MQLCRLRRLRRLRRILRARVWGRWRWHLLLCGLLAGRQWLSLRGRLTSSIRIKQFTQQLWVWPRRLRNAVLVRGDVCNRRLYVLLIGRGLQEYGLIFAGLGDGNNDRAFWKIFRAKNHCQKDHHVNDKRKPHGFTPAIFCEFVIQLIDKEMQLRHIR